MRIRNKLGHTLRECRLEDIVGRSEVLHQPEQFIAAYSILGNCDWIETIDRYGVGEGCQVDSDIASGIRRDVIRNIIKSNTEPI